MTASGTGDAGRRAGINNVRQFEGLQQANATVQRGHASYNAGWAQNSAPIGSGCQRLRNQAIRSVGLCRQQRSADHAASLPRGRPVNGVATPYARTPGAPAGAGRATVERGWMRRTNEAAAQFLLHRNAQLTLGSQAESG